MNGLDQVRRGLGRAWDSVLEGWQHLRENAAGAITRFVPSKEAEEVETSEDRIALHSPRWGLMAAEVRESEDEVTVRLEAPGMEPGDFDLRVEDGYLLIAGEKRVEREDRKSRHYVLEAAYGRFERAVPLPVAVDEEQARAQYRRGVLHVTLPKSERARHRRIAVERD
ncbi:Hsp20/alpha crystallin family protein [Thiohalorhabdus sp. Cl-TMA]|uniref:Hsp20/alpha crystallin family protein n=1 Tax=Thiohalorhabdus methylotrophus TaxID=3242694 RepID=A0ABV4TT47_9GAMM